MIVTIDAFQYDADDYCVQNFYCVGRDTLTITINGGCFNLVYTKQ